MSRAIRVAFINQVGNIGGGAERTLAIFLKHAPPTIEPIVILFEDGDFANELRSFGIPVEIIAAPQAITNVTRYRGYLAAAFSAPFVALRLVRALHRKRADIVYTNSMKAHVVGGIAALLAGKRCVMHFHDLYQGAALLVLRLCGRLTSRVRIACSELVAKEIGIGATSVIYAPIDGDILDRMPARAGALERLGIEADLPIVALIGRINRWKGHDRFLRIAALVNARVATQFLIVGSPIFRDADFLDELHILVEQLGLFERVRFIPWLQDVRDVYAVIDVNANCSTREPFGRSIPEAAAAGVPTVCFADSGGAETISDGTNGRIIAAGDEAAFAEAIVGYIENRCDRLHASDVLKAFSRQFDATRIAAQTEAVIKSATIG